MDQSFDPSVVRCLNDPQATGWYAGCRVCDPEAEAALPWIGYDEAMATLPRARWLAMAARLHHCCPGKSGC